MRDLFKKFLLKNFFIANQMYKYFRLLPNFFKKILIEFYFFFPKQKSIFPSRLTIFLTDKCNMKCGHCFIIKEVPKKTNELSLEDYKKIFSSLEGKTSQILFTGGEPTLRKDFYDIIYHAYYLGGVSTVSIFSNSFYPDKTCDLISKILLNTKLNIHYHTSIDGEKQFHNFNRRVRGSYDKVKETIVKLNNLKGSYKKRLSRIVVNVSISKYNNDQLGEVINDFKGQNCLFGFGFTRHNNKVLNIKPEYITEDLGVEKFKSDGNEKFSDGFLNVKEMKDIYNYLDKNVWSLNDQELIYAFQKISMNGRIAFDEKNISPISIECGMGYDDLVILTNGKIARCEMLKPFANLKDYDFNLNKFYENENTKLYLKNTSGCFCEHECAISVTAMSDKKLLKNF